MFVNIPRKSQNDVFEKKLCYNNLQKVGSEELPSSRRLKIGRVYYLRASLQAHYLEEIMTTTPALQD